MEYDYKKIKEDIKGMSENDIYDYVIKLVERKNDSAMSEIEIVKQLKNDGYNLTTLGLRNKKSVVANTKIKYTYFSHVKVMDEIRQLRLKGNEGLFLSVLIRIYYYNVMPRSEIALLRVQDVYDDHIVTPSGTWYINDFVDKNFISDLRKIHNIKVIKFRKNMYLSKYKEYLFPMPGLNDERRAKFIINFTQRIIPDYTIFSSAKEIGQLGILNYIIYKSNGEIDYLNPTAEQKKVMLMWYEELSSNKYVRPSRYDALLGKIFEKYKDQI